MPGNSVLVGPFQAGLSTYSDPTVIADNELAVANNWDIDVDGSLKSRPPFVDRGVTLTLNANGGNMRILGYYYQANYVASNQSMPYIVASDGYGSTYYFDGSTWHLITSSLAAVSMTQFNGQLWLVAPSGVCGYWTPSGGWVADPWCPNGESITVFKSRMFVAAGGSASGRTQVSSSNTAVPDVNDIYYSAVLGESPWLAVTSGANQSPGIQTFKVNSGDGQASVSLLNFQGALYIFRTASIWTFTYSANPQTGVVSLMVPNVGLADSQAITVFENYIYFMYDGRAYSLFSGIATLFNPKVPFSAVVRTGTYTPFAVSQFNRRIIFTYYDTMYVYSLRSQSWTTWRSPTYGSIGKVVQYQGAQTSDVPVAVTHSSLVSSRSGNLQKLLYITDTFTSEVETGGYVCSMTTKTFDYGAPTNYKRLFWWALDATFRGQVTAKVNPQLYSYQTTWSQLFQSRTWGSARNYSWGNPILGGFTDSTVVAAQMVGTLPQRSTVRLFKNQRFRQVNYSVSMQVDGSQGTCPARLFLIETFVLVKDRVSKQIS